MALASTGQDDFGAGIHRGREAPANAAYDIVNGLINDEGQIYRRGGSTYYSASNAGSTISRVRTAKFAGPDTDRVLAWGQKLYTFNGTTPVEIYDPAGSIVYGKPVGVGGVVVWPAQSGSGLGYTWSQIFIYGGSLLTASVVNEGTITVTAGSTAVTKAGGASWVGVVDAGMILSFASGTYGIVRSVDGANALTLLYPWGGATTSTGTYTLQPNLLAAVGSTLPTGIPATDPIYLGSAARRLLVGIGNRVYFCPPGFPFAFDKDTYHELPAATDINGIQGMGDTAAIFSSDGVWTVSQLSMDPVDAYGNIQHVVQQISGEVILWGELGGTPWNAGSMIVPALDDIYALGLDGSTTRITGDPENEKIRRLYRAHTAVDGRRPGTAAIYRGHLILPIVENEAVVDTLVCRLDRGTAWTRWSGHAGGPGFATLAATETAAPKLLGVNGERVTNLTGCFDPTSSNAVDADATVHVADVITRDFPTGQQPGFVQRARIRYELTDGGTPDPAVAIAFSSDQDAGTFTALTERGEQNGGTGWGVSNGSLYQWALVAKRRERIRFRIRVTGACASFVLRGIELLTRPQGRQ